MKRYFAIAGLLFLALTINIAWTGKAPWLGFWGLTVNQHRKMTRVQRPKLTRVSWLISSSV